jgi:hypothetical protein
MRTEISVDAYEAAERDLLLAHARKIWRRHATTFALVVGGLILFELRSDGASWLVYLALAAWAVVVGLHYRGWVRYGDARIREQQSRIEWRAGRGGGEHLLLRPCAPRRRSPRTGAR